MSQWTCKEFTNISAGNVEQQIMDFLHANLHNTPPILVKISITDAAHVDAYGIIVYYNDPNPVQMPTIYGSDRWDAADYATAAAAVNHLNELDHHESILAQLTVRKLTDTITWTVVTPHGA